MDSIPIYTVGVLLFLLNNEIMATTKINALRAKYNAQIEGLKQRYKEENNLKIARGFGKKGTLLYDEYKRINRNKKQALYRYDKSNQSNRLQSPIKVRTLATDSPHHNVLDYGESSAKRAVRDAFSKAKRNKDKKPARLVIKSDFDQKGEAIYTNVFQSELAIKDLYQRCNQFQEETNDYVFCTLTTASTDKEEFVVIIARSFKGGN